MYKHTGYLTTENKDLKQIKQIREITLTGLKSRDDTIAKLQTRLMNITNDMQANSNERKRQTDILARNQLSHEKFKREQQLRLQQQQQQLQRQQQQLNLQVQQRQQQQRQQQQQRHQQQQVTQKNADLTYFDNLDQQHANYMSNSEDDSDSAMSNNDEMDQYDNGYIQQHNDRNRHQQLQQQHQEISRKKIKKNLRNPRVHEDLQAYYDNNH